MMDRPSLLIRLWKSDPAFRVGGVVGALAGFLPMLYLGMAFGTLGGAWGKSLLGAAIGIPIGILTSLVILVIGGTLATGAAGGFLAISVVRGVGKLRADGSK